MEISISLSLALCLLNIFLVIEGAYTVKIIKFIIVLISSNSIVFYQLKSIYLLIFFFPVAFDVFCLLMHQLGVLQHPRHDWLGTVLRARVLHWNCYSITAITWRKLTRAFDLIPSAVIGWKTVPRLHVFNRIRSDVISWRKCFTDSC